MKGTLIQRPTFESIGDDHFWAAPWLRRRRGARIPHLGALEEAAMTRIDGGGSGERLARVALAGTTGINGGELLNFLGYWQQLRRGFTARLCTNKMAKRARVSAWRERNTVQGLGKEMGQPNGVAAVAFYLGHGEVADGRGQRARPPGGAQRGVEWVWCSVVSVARRGGG